MSKKPVGFYTDSRKRVRPITKPMEISHGIPQIRTYQVIPARTVEFKMVQMPVKDVAFSEVKPVDLDRRAAFFMDMYRNGKTIPPILVHKLPDGKYEVIDGHARLEAYRRLGVTEIPAVENSIADIFRKIGSGVKQVGVGVAKGAYYGTAPAKEERQVYGKGQVIGAELGAGVRKALRETPKALGYLSGLPSGARMSYREGKAMAESSDASKRRIAIQWLRENYPEVLEKLQQPRSQPSQPRGKTWIEDLKMQKERGQMEGYGYY
jgi:hypothetical protein